MWRKHLPTLIPNHIANRPLRAEMLLFAMHDVHPETGEHAVERFRGDRVLFLFLSWTRRTCFYPLRGPARENDLGRERDHLLYDVLRTEVAP